MGQLWIQIILLHHYQRHFNVQKKKRKNPGLILNHTLFFCHLTAICDFNNHTLITLLILPSLYRVLLRCAQGMLLKTCYLWTCNLWESAGMLVRCAVNREAGCILYGMTPCAGVIRTLRFENDCNDRVEFTCKGYDEENTIKMNVFFQSQMSIRK